MGKAAESIRVREPADRPLAVVWRSDWRSVAVYLLAEHGGEDDNQELLQLTADQALALAAALSEAAQ